jgi:hypothetical protein
MLTYLIRSFIDIYEILESYLYNPILLQLDLNMYAFFIGLL